ncbi:MAG: hypothetical protein R3C61_01890 [Bacteroidia bacterium]
MKRVPHKYFRLTTAFSLLLIILFPGLSAQGLVGERKLKDFPTDNPWYYPYDFSAYNPDQIQLLHTPSIRVSDAAFVQLWQSEKGATRERHLTRYNVFMEEEWDAVFKLDSEEDILHFYSEDSVIVVLTSKYNFLSGIEQVIARVFGLEDGTAAPTHLLWQSKTRSDESVWFDFSPDSSLFALFHFRNDRPYRNVHTAYDPWLSTERVGFKVTNAEYVEFRLFDRKLTLADTGRVSINNRRLTVMDCQTDNAGNFYVSSFEKPNTLQVVQWNREKKNTSRLHYDQFPDRNKLKEFYYTRFPPVTGDSNRLYIAVAERAERGKQRGIKSWQVVNFDFETGQVDLSRKMEITSTLLVNAEKQRKSYGMRPLKRFDLFMAMDIVEMADKSVWLITQNYHTTQGRTYGFEHTTYRHSEQEIGEIIMYGFDPEGQVRQVIFVPTSQQTKKTVDLPGQFYHLEVDRTRGIMRFVTRESSEDDLRGPDRIYYRRVNLNTGEISPRLMLYDGKRREQFLLKAYTVWLNPSLVTLVMIDGEEGNAYAVCVNVDSEEAGDATKKKEKWWR